MSQINILEACRQADIDPVILVVGSAEEYGDVSSDSLPITEDQPLRPANPYAVSKVTQDMLGLQYYLTYGMKIVRVRPFNHIGPGQSDRFVVANFARQIAEAEIGRSEPVLLTGNLDAERDFLDVRDVVRAYTMVTRAAFAGQVFNVAGGAPRSIGWILQYLLDRATVPITVRTDTARLRPADASILYGDASRLHDATGWEPLIPIERSLDETLAYWRERVRTGR